MQIPKNQPCPRCKTELIKEQAPDSYAQHFRCPACNLTFWANAKSYFKKSN